MYLDGSLVILTAGKVRVCLVVAIQHKYLRLLCVPLCEGLCVIASCCAGKCAAGNVFGGANVGGEFRQCLGPF
jgi:hypothetical protein